MVSEKPSIDAIFGAAIEIESADDRQAYLERACGEDASLRRQVERLLSAHFGAGNFLDAPAPALQAVCEESGPPSGSVRGLASGVLGDFRILREIGCGGMGLVFEAEQLSLGRRVALKVLPFVALVDPKQLQRFQNEARAAASLNHPNIVSVYSVGCDRGVHYYAMEFIEGETLAQVIAELRASVASGADTHAQFAALSPFTRSLLRGDAPPPQTPPQSATGDPVATSATQPSTDAAVSDSSPSSKRGNASRTFPSSGNLTGNRIFFRAAASLGIQAADALEHAHQVGIVHRDIKPSNLMVDTAGHLWITDFGLATGNTFTGPTMTGDVLGTLRYMSPEQASGERRILDGRTDVYSLGVTLYELVTLQPAFPAENRQELLGHIANAEPLPPHQLNPRTPRELETIILKAMAKEPASRYDSSRELADDLRRFLADEPIRARRPSLWARSAKWSRRHRPVVWSAMSLLVVTTVLAIVGVVLIARERREAIGQRDEAQRQREEVRRREVTQRRHLNVANVQWAWKAWHSGKLEQAAAYLAQQLPAPGEEDTRSFAWHYLWRLCHSSYQVLDGHSGAVYSLAFSPDGKTLLSGGADHKVIHWDIATLQERTRWEDFPDDVNCIRYSSDGRLVATAGEEKRVRIWDAASAQLVISLTEFELPVAAVSFAPDNKHLFASEVNWKDRTSSFTSTWDLSSGKRERRFKGHILAMSPDRSAALLNRGLWTWNSEPQQDSPNIRGPSLPASPLAAVWSPDGKTVASGGLPRVIRVQKMPGLEDVTTLYWHTGQIRSLEFSPDGNLLASAGDDGLLLTCDASSWDLQGVLSCGGFTVWVVTFSPAGKWLAAGCGDGKIRIWDPAANRAYVRIEGGFPQRAGLGFTSHDELAVAGSPQQPSWGLWDVSTGRSIKSFNTPDENAEYVATSPTEPLVAVGMAGGTVRWVDGTSGEPRFTFPPSEADNWGIRQLIFSPNGKYLAAVHARWGPRPFLMRVWDVASGRPLLVRQVEPSKGWAEGQPIAFSPDSQTLAVSLDQKVHLCDVDAGTMSTMPGGPLDAAWSVAYSPDGQWLAVGTLDSSLRLVDPRNPTVGRELVGPRGLANALAFSPDGRTLASGSGAGEVTLWDVETGEEMLTLEGPTGSVWCLAFSPDGTHLAANSELPNGRSAVYVWHAPRLPASDVRLTRGQR